MADGDMLFGVAGWSYPDWKGIVYPAGCKDTLQAVARRVDLIEINNTFYRCPDARNCGSWAQRTAATGTAFTAKLPREFTHQPGFDDALVAQVRAGFAPLAESGRFLGLLAQFSHTFRFGTAAERHLDRLAAAFRDLAPLFIEVRDRSWNADAALAAAARAGVGVLELDYPGMTGGFSRDVTGVRARGGLAYFRLHGRNRAWFRRGATRDEVYDWRYSADEVEQLWVRLQRIRATASRTIVVANNHFHGKAMTVIEDLLRLRARAPGAGPP